MITVDESLLNEALRLLSEIDDDPVHPANDARHPDHAACVQAYIELYAWCTEQREWLAKMDKLYGVDDPV